MLAVEVPVVIFKAFILIMTAFLAALAFRHLHAMIIELSAVKAKARVRPQSAASKPVRLRQDPRTGIYFPEN